jgi:hypothetical protein
LLARTRARKNIIVPPNSQCRGTNSRSSILLGKHGNGEIAGARPGTLIRASQSTHRHQIGARGAPGTRASAHPYARCGAPISPETQSEIPNRPRRPARGDAPDKIRPSAPSRRSSLANPKILFPRNRGIERAADTTNQPRTTSTGRETVRDRGLRGRSGGGGERRCGTPFRRRRRRRRRAGCRGEEERADHRGWLRMRDLGPKRVGRCSNTTSCGRNGKRPLLAPPVSGRGVGPPLPSCGTERGIRWTWPR